MEFVILAISLGVMAGAFLVIRRGFKPRFRQVNHIRAFPVFVGQAVEKGGKAHLYTAANALGTEKSITTLAALSLLDPLTKHMPVSDQAPVFTSADTASSFTMMDKTEVIYRLKSAYDDRERLPVYQIALEPISGAAAEMSLIHSNPIEASIIMGSIGTEAAVIAEPGNRKKISQMISSDLIEGQAAAQTLCDYPLVGEEPYLAPLQLRGETATSVTLISADIIRWVIVIMIVLGVVLRTIGVMGGV